MNLYSELTRKYRNQPDQVVLDCDDSRQWTYTELNALIDAIESRLLAFGLFEGDRILVQVFKSAEAIALYLACLRMNLIFVPLNTAYTKSEFDYFVKDADPALVVIDPDSVLENLALPVLTLSAKGDGSLLEHSKSVTCDSATSERLALWSRSAQSKPAVIIYTSGTTGRSKGAVLSQANLYTNARALTDTWNFSEQDVLLHVLPVFHVHGLFVALNTAMLSGARIRFCAGFDPVQVCAELPGTTVFMGVPTHYTRLLACTAFSRACCETIRLFISGSAPLLPETFDQFARVSGQSILERYGMSETNIICSNPLKGERIAGTVGFALGGTTLRVVGGDDQSVAENEIGFVQVCGDSVFDGYWRRPDLAESEFTSDGFFRTGDLGRLDAYGRLTLDGRQKDLIISGGLNVYPAEIERVLDAAPGVLESAVVGVADADFGERVEAFIVSDGTCENLEESLKNLALEKLANFKRPKAIHLIEALPRNTMGKVQKTRLRQQAH
ncbi:MAG: AMP-binding protein [Gammaproteobacteria bacterium]